MQKMGGDGVGGCRWLAVVSREKRSRERWCGALLSASLDLPKLGSGQRGRKPSVPPTLFCRCLSWPTRILAETVRTLVGTVCRNFDVASNGGSQPSNGITQPSGCAFPRLLKTHMISIASRADGLSGWPHIYAACTPFYIGLWPRRRADPACPTPRKRCMTCWQLGPAECERSDFALCAQVAPNLEPQMRSQF